MRQRLSACYVLRHGERTDFVVGVRVQRRSPIDRRVCARNVTAAQIRPAVQRRLEHTS